MKSFEEVHTLVTGGAGFIGSHVVDELMDLGANVRAIDNLSNGTAENLSRWIENPRFELLIEDIRNRNSVKSALKDIEVVFHQAAKVSVPASIKDPHLTMDVNVMGTTVLLDECRKGSVSKIVTASSSSVYGDIPSLPKVESVSTNPISPYAASKLAEESLTVVFYSTYGMDTTALRYFNVYGPRQRSGVYAGVVSIFINNAIRGKPLPVEGDGLQSRDFTYVQDVVKCNILAAVKIEAKGKVYNVGSGIQTSVQQLADIIIGLADSSSQKHFLPERRGDIRHSLASLDLIHNDLGYIPEFELERGLQKTIEWIRTKN